MLERVERDIMLQIVDVQWKDHLYSLDHLKEGIGLRGYGQRDPLVEYKKESFMLFQAMKERVDEEIVRYLWWLRPVITESGEAGAADQAPARPRRSRQRRPLLFNNPSEPPPHSARRVGEREASSDSAFRRTTPRASRRASAATTHRSKPSSGTSPRWDATIRVRAAAERNTRSAMGPPPDPVSP